MCIFFFFCGSESLVSVPESQRNTAAFTILLKERYLNIKYNTFCFIFGISDSFCRQKITAKNNFLHFFCYSTVTSKIFSYCPTTAVFKVWSKFGTNVLRNVLRNDTANWRRITGIVTRLRCGRQGTEIRFPEGACDFSHLQIVQIDSGTNPASYSVGNGASSPGDKTLQREADH